jgi:hypothetical protein
VAKQLSGFRVFAFYLSLGSSDAPPVQLPYRLYSLTFRLRSRFARYNTNADLEEAVLHRIFEKRNHKGTEFHIAFSTFKPRHVLRAWSVPHSSRGALRQRLSAGLPRLGVREMWIACLSKSEAISKSEVRPGMNGVS